MMAPQCPYIVTGKEGTSYCRLAEGEGRAAQQVKEVLALINAHLSTKRDDLKDAVSQVLQVMLLEQGNAKTAERMLSERIDLSRIEQSYSIAEAVRAATSQLNQQLADLWAENARLKEAAQGLLGWFDRRSTRPNEPWEPHCDRLARAISCDEPSS